VYKKVASQSHHKYKKKILFPAKQKTAQFSPFSVCFIRELNLYSPLVSIFIYDVIVKQLFYKRSTNHYLGDIRKGQ